MQTLFYLVVYVLYKEYLQQWLDSLWNQTIVFMKIVARGYFIHNPDQTCLVVISERHATIHWNASSAIFKVLIWLQLAISCGFNFRFNRPYFFCSFYVSIAATYNQMQLATISWYFPSVVMPFWIQSCWFATRLSPVNYICFFPFFRIGGVEINMIRD